MYYKVFCSIHKTHHSYNKYVFWAYSASAFYTKSVKTRLNQNNIPFVSLQINVANLPKARKIEEWWMILKREA